MHVVRSPLLCSFLALFAFAVATVATAAEPTKLWHDNRITPEQPFPARVIGVIPSWIGYAVLLEEITEKEPRFCIATLWATADLAYTIVPDNKAFQKVHDSQKATYLTPGVEADGFSWSMDAYLIGSRFGDKDLVTRQYPGWTKRAKKPKRESQQPTSDSKGRQQRLAGRWAAPIADLAISG